MSELAQNRKSRRLRGLSGPSTMRTLQLSKDFCNIVLQMTGTVKTLKIGHATIDPSR